MDNQKRINDIIDYQAKSLVGTLLKRIEVFQDEEERTNKIVLTPSLYKAIIREFVYENSRQTKALFRVLNERTIIFKSRPTK